MSIQVETKDCTAINDTELAEMADLCAEREPRFDIGFLSKQREEWVLVTRAREGTKLRGYSFSTLERIGGTPSLLIGLATVDRTARADTVLRAMMGDKYRRALLAFPDEDVLVGTRLVAAEGFRVFAGLTDVVPGPDHKATGEERAWGRRLAKRFGCRGPHRRPDLRPGGRRVRVRGVRLQWSQGQDARRGAAALRDGESGDGRAPRGLRVGHGRGPGRIQAGWALNRLELPSGEAISTRGSSGSPSPGSSMAT